MLICSITVKHQGEGGIGNGDKMYISIKQIKNSKISRQFSK